MSVALVALDKTRTLWSTGRRFAVENSKKPTESWRADVGGGDWAMRQTKYKGKPETLHYTF